MVYMGVLHIRILIHAYKVVSWVIGVPLVIIQLNRMFPFTKTIQRAWGTPHDELETSICITCIPYPWRIRMYGRLMRIQNWGFCWWSMLPYIAYIHGSYGIEPHFFGNSETETVLVPPGMLDTSKGSAENQVGLLASAVSRPRCVLHRVAPTTVDMEVA